MARKVKSAEKNERREELTDEHLEDEAHDEMPAVDGADEIPSVDGAGDATAVGGDVAEGASEAAQLAEAASLSDVIGDRVGDAEIDVDLGLGAESLPQVNLGFGDSRASQDGSGGEAPTQSGDSDDDKGGSIRDVFGNTYDRKDDAGVAHNDSTGSWIDGKGGKSYDAESDTEYFFYKQGDQQRTSGSGGDGSSFEAGEKKDGSEWQSEAGPLKKNGDREISKVEVTAEGTATESTGTVKTGGYTERTTTTADGIQTSSEFKTEDGSWHNSDGSLKSHGMKDFFAGGDEGPEGTGATPGQVNRAYDGKTDAGVLTNSATGAWYDKNTNTEYNPETGKTTTFGTDGDGNRTRSWTHENGSSGTDTVNAEGVIIDSVRVDADGTKHVFSEHGDGGFTQETFNKDGSAESVGLDAKGDLHVLQFDEHGNEITFDDVIDDLAAGFDEADVGGEVGDVFDATTNTTTHADGSTTRMRADGSFEHRDAQGREVDPVTGEPVAEQEATPTSTTPAEGGEGDEGDGDGSGGGGGDGDGDGEAKEKEKEGDGDGGGESDSDGDGDGGGGEGTDGEEADEDTDDASQPAGDGQGTGAAGGDEIDLPEADESTAAEDFWADPTKAMLGQPGEGDEIPPGGSDPQDYIDAPEPDVGLPAYAAPSLERVDPLDVLGQPGEVNNEDLSALETPRGTEDWVINPSDQSSASAALGDSAGLGGAGDGGLGAPSPAMLAAFPEAYGQAGASEPASFAGMPETGSPVADASPVAPLVDAGLVPAATGGTPGGIAGGTTGRLAAAGGEDEEEGIQMSSVAAGGEEEEEGIQMSSVAAGGEEEEEGIQMSSVAAGGEEEEEDIQMSHAQQEEEEEVQASPVPDSVDGGGSGIVGIGEVGVGATSGISIISSPATDLGASVLDSPLGSDLTVDDIAGGDVFGEDLGEALD